MPTDSGCLPPVVVALGGFDGVHLGHQQIIRRCRELARKDGALPAVLTFDPLPAQLVYPDFTYVLTPLAEKATLLTELGVELVHAVRFTPAVRDTAPEDFVRDHIVAPLHPLAVVVGHDHRFGAKGSGDVTLLRRLLAEHHIGLEVVPEFLHLDAPVRSTRIREHLLLGHVALAAELLGRPYALSGTIVSGTATGRRLGFPTINIQPREPEK
ncbi:MAG: riboflavin kinase, partial [candidate division WOR-3 bacterium]